MSSKTAFKCCKNKQFLHYVCVKCYGIYHKCCLPKHKEKIKFIEENKLLCCEESNSTSENDEISLLEKTISDLTEDSEQKNKYIQKIRAEHKAFLIEATKREEELLELLQQQEEKISELNVCITELKKSVRTSHCTTSTISTQTMHFDNTKNCSTSTDLSMQNLNFLISDKKLTVSTKSKEAQKPNDKIQVQTNLDSRENENCLNRNDKGKKNQILILSDENDINWQIRKILDLQLYETMSIKKPGALLDQVMENIEILTKNFTFHDFVIIIGGSNDIKNKRIPLFRSICNKLKLCSHTNILFASVPYVENKQNSNRLIYKFNTKLNDFLSKFNNYTEGVIKYVEINIEHCRKFRKSMVADQIFNTMSSAKYMIKNLTFIKTSDHINYDELNLSQTTEPSAPTSKATSPTITAVPSGAPDVLIIEEEKNPSSNFLYPCLAEISFQT